MKKSAFSKRLISIATASMLLVSSFSAMLTASAEGSNVYPLLDTADYQAGANTEGLAQDNLLTDVVDGKTLNGVTATTDVSGNAYVYVDCKTPAEAGFALSDIHSVAYYFKNKTGKEISVALEYANGDAYGRLTGGLIYTVPVNGLSVKVAKIADGSNGAVNLPKGFEGYVVYDVDTATDKTLLTDGTTFGPSVQVRIASALSADDTFYYGEICASTDTAINYIASVNSAAVYQYPLVYDMPNQHPFYTQSIDTTDPYNPIFTAPLYYGNEANPRANMKNYVISDFGRTTDEISTVSFYVKNTTGNGEIGLALLHKDSDKSFTNPEFYLYDINTGSIGLTGNRYGWLPLIPDGFEGYVIIKPTNQTDLSTLFTSGDLCFYNEQTPNPVKVSIGSVTAWTGDYNNVIAAMQKSLEPEPVDLDVYELLDTENYQAGENTEGITQNNGLTDVVDGKTLNGITVNSDIAENANVYIDCKTPAEAGMDITKINGFSYYFKNASDREVSVAFEYANGDTFGRLTGGRIHTVPVNYESAKIAQVAANTDGAVKIPAGFEGYIVYNARTATDKSLLNADTTFGSNIRLRFASELKAGDAFYYGDVCAFLGKDSEYITSVKSDAVCQYPLVYDMPNQHPFYTQSIDTTDPYNPIFTAPLYYGNEANPRANMKNYVISDFGRTTDEISTVSFYVKNTTGNGEIGLALLHKDSDKSFTNPEFYLYDINTGSIGLTGNRYGWLPLIPDGFEGYVIIKPTNQTDLSTLFTSGDLCFYNEQGPNPVKVSIGSVTAWTGEYNKVLDAMVGDRNAFDVATKDNDEYEFSIQYTEGLNTAFDGSVVNVYNWDSDISEIELKYDFAALYGTYLNASKYHASAEALTLYFKNEEGKDLRVSGIKVGGNAVSFTYKLFDTEKQTMTPASALGTDVIVPDGFEGYIVMYPESVGGSAWQDYFASNDIGVVTVALDTTDAYLGADADCYVGKLTIVKSVNDFIKDNLAVTLEGDANRDGKVDLLDLIRLKKNSAGNEGAVVYVPNVSYGGNNSVTSASTAANLKKQLMGAEHENAFVSEEVFAALVS